MPRPSPIPGMDASEYAMRWLLSRGWSQAAAAGIVGNLIHESVGLNTGIVGDRGTSYGIAQWRGVRWKALADFARRNKVPINDLDLQLSFMHRELTEDPTYRKALRGLMIARNPAEAAGYFAEHFERPRGSGRGNFAAIHGWTNRARHANAMFQGRFDQAPAERLPAAQAQPAPPLMQRAPLPPQRPPGLDLTQTTGSIEPLPTGPDGGATSGAAAPEAGAPVTPPPARPADPFLGAPAAPPATPENAWIRPDLLEIAGPAPPPPAPDPLAGSFAPPAESFPLSEPQAEATFAPMRIGAAAPMPPQRPPGLPVPVTAPLPPDWSQIFNFGGLFGR